MSARLIEGDCLQVMRGMEPNSVSSIVCDPPYMIDFMGKAFDTSKNNIAGRVEVWAEALRVAKPGAHLLAFGGDRTHHRMMCAIEDAGWELRTCLYWCFGSGFPKSHSVDKAIDRMAGKEREVVGTRSYAYPDTVRPSKRSVSHGDEGIFGLEFNGSIQNVTAPATDAAKQWLGWGSALKPAVEIIVMARKPLSEPTIAANVLRWGTGGINVDGCRIGTDEVKQAHVARNGGIWQSEGGDSLRHNGNGTSHSQGRWPANLILDDDAAALLDEMSGTITARNGGKTGTNPGYDGGWNDHATDIYRDTGGASRFFYVAKASKRDRDEGLEGMPEREAYKLSGGEFIAEGRTAIKGKAMARNHHPTVKPTQLMRWLVRLATPPGGTVLDPFCGSGSTGKAAVLEGFDFVGIDNEAEYLEIAAKRIAHAQAQMQMPLLEIA